MKELEGSKENITNISIDNSSYQSLIPKIFHRIWMNWDQKTTELPAKYQEFDTNLRNLHPDWQVMEWNETSILSFIEEFYPSFLPTYLSYDVPVKQHDACRYLIVDHFGGVFIQHSIKLQKNIEPLLTGDVVFSKQCSRDNSLVNGFFASIPNHDIWKYIISEMEKTKAYNVILATGPKFLAKKVETYQKQHNDSSVDIIDHKHLFPFDWTSIKGRAANPEIISKCITNHEQCFELFPEAYGFTLWTAQWKSQYSNSAIKRTPINIEVSNYESLLNKTITRSSNATEIGAYEARLSNITQADYANAKLAASAEEKVKFCVVIPSYNNQAYVPQNLNSVFVQNYHNWKIVYIDDASTDGTAELALSIKNNGNFSDDKFAILNHPTRIQSPTYSFYQAAYNYCNNNDVMVHLDGDDMISSPAIFNKLANIYSGGEIWITFGTYIKASGGMGIDAARYNISTHLDNLRSSNWITSHLRTSYTWLFKEIKKEDLQLNGEFLHATGDLAMMYPMLEMAGKERAFFISEITYIYRHHENNVMVVNITMQNNNSKYIRSLEPYQKLLAKPNQYSEIATYNMPDKTYVINLDVATSRWKAVSEKLDNVNIEHSRLPATNGLLIKITDQQTQEVFFGIDIKNKVNQIQNDMLYNINCDPENQNAFNFLFRGFLNYAGNTITAGELGLWCSALRLLQDAKNNNHQQIIMFEDDIAPFPNFKQDLSNLLNNLPETYDLAYIDFTLKGTNNTIKINDFVNKVTSNAYGWGAYAIGFSNQGINKILSAQEYTAAFDNWLWCYTSGMVAPRHPYFPNSKCKPYAGTLETYSSSVKMLDVLRLCDEYSITEMGRVGALACDTFSAANE